MTEYRSGIVLTGLMIFIFALLFQPASAQGNFKFDIASKVAGIDNYTKHWSDTYPPDPKADIILYTAAYNMSYKRMSALSFVYTVYDPMNNIVAVGKSDVFKRNYDADVVYFTLHPNSDWIEGSYRVRMVVYDMLDRAAFDNITDDPLTIGVDSDKYKTFYETGSNAQDMGVLLSQGVVAAQGDMNFQISKSVTIYPPDRFLLHGVRFTDNITDRIMGEKLQIEVKVDNNYKDDGTVRLAMLVDNGIVSTKDVTVKGLSTSTVQFDAKAGKIGTFKLHFGTDTPDVKYSNAELTFSIKSESESTRLELPRIEITEMNVDKEFVAAGGNVTVTVKVVNNGKSGSKTITVYSNQVPVGSADVNLQYLEEKTLQIPIVLKNMGINKITVSDTPSLYRNVFVQEPESLQSNPVVQRISSNPLKISMVLVFMVFAGTLYYVKKRLA